MLAFRDGDFSARLPSDWSGTDGQIAGAFNQVIALEDRIAREVGRLSIAVGKEGRLRQRMMVPGALGGFRISAGWSDDVSTTTIRPAKAGWRRIQRNTKSLAIAIGCRGGRAQLLLKLGELEKLAAVTRPVQSITFERSAPRARPLPAETFAKLPVKETVEIIPAAVQAAPQDYERIGEERTFEVDVVPPQLFKREIVRPKYRRKDDRNVAPVIAPGAGAAGNRRLCVGGPAGVDCVEQVC